MDDIDVVEGAQGGGTVIATQLHLIYEKLHATVQFAFARLGSYSHQVNEFHVAMADLDRAETRTWYVEGSFSPAPTAWARGQVDTSLDVERPFSAFATSVLTSEHLFLPTRLKEVLRAITEFRGRSYRDP